MKKYVDKDKLQEFATKLHNKQKTIFATKESIAPLVGSPLVASTAAQMTDTNKIYVYVGSETGYTAGNWYYYDGSEWTSGGVYNSTAIQTDTTLSVSGMAADAAAVGAALTGSDGLTADIKQALLQIAEKVAYIDEDGQDYYDALEAALYPDATLVSISAVYTQSGTVYDTDSLNDLKNDLVVTAHYDDYSSETVTAYTLSGTLEAGTSTITVTYGEKTTTFNVTVTASSSALYPMPNGSHSYTDSEYTNRSITITNNNHVAFSNPSATSETTTASYCIIDDVSDNGTSANTSNINSPSTPLFTLPANASVEFVIDNISVSKAGSIAQYTKFAIALRSGSTSVVSTGDLTTETSKTVTQTITNATDITCLFVFAGAQFKSIEFDVHLTVNGETWI